LIRTKFEYAHHENVLHANTCPHGSLSARSKLTILREQMLVTGYVMNIYDPLAQIPNPFARHAVAKPTEPEFVMAPHIASQAVPLSKITETKKTKKNLDEIEEISPAGPDDGTKPATSSLYPDLWGIEEDAAMARRLATQEEAKYWVSMSEGAPNRVGQF
jgi:hypothetical protein